ncbi:haloacid dehalogenase-like hydrolase [Streptomyces sp. TG1A-8]|uniref:HAD family hydrolase n=1 Tax=Streptomyces sp. TG1A-8 TaxID=3051385 RepID=UPI00265C222D|nr:haloacid dehalogenase-like hydrolase [Streptomyces sp. TG1A-8]MDO0929514.1 haloacid dehalogenase-like hydrolase [Streptomyces sp. TG1A-8]
MTLPHGCPDDEPEWAPTALAVFDMDGTLLPGTTACRQIALVAEDPLVVERLEGDYRDGLIDSTEFARRALASWAHAGPGLYRRAFDACPKIGGVERTLAWLRARSVVTCLITMAPRPFAECFTGFDHVFASSYPDDILNPEDKPEVVRRLQRRLGIDGMRTIAFGDSDSDIPLFRALTRTVAVNATPNLAAMAARRYDGDDLWEALRTLYALRERQP